MINQNYKKYKSRILFLTFLTVVIFIFIIIRLLFVQYFNYDFWSKEAKNIQRGFIRIQRSRGKIFDRNMKTLAISIQSHNLVISPRRVKNIDKIFTDLVKILDVDPKKVYEKIYKRRTYIKRYISDEQTKAIRKLLRKNPDVKGVEIRKSFKRYYPKNRLAANIIGFTNYEGKGLEGLEYKYNKILKSEPGKLYTLISPGGIEIPNDEAFLKSPKGGKHIVLTIDETIQNIIEDELEKVVTNSQAKKGMIIVMNPKTGDILGMANYPTFDPNHFRDYPYANYKNRCITDLYEPGSTMKPFVMSAAIEEDRINLNDKFFCDGKIEFKKHIMRCYTHHGFLTPKESIKLSCNDVIAAIAKKVGAPLYYEYLKKFGFDEKTGIQLLGEANQRIPPVKPEIWPPIDLAARSIGYSIGVTAIQMITGLSAIVNDGVLMKPRIIKAILSNDGKLLREFKPKVIRRVISSETSLELKDMLRAVVEENGTGKIAKIKGLDIGGKTGTAKKVKNGVYSEEAYILSFFGFVPVNNPKYSVIVIVDEPKYKKNLYGGSVAAPAFRNIIKRIYQIEEKTPIEDVKAEFTTKKSLKIQIPNFIGKTKQEITQLSKKLNLNVEIIGFSGKAVEQIPTYEKDKKIIPESEKILVYLKNQKVNFITKMPNFIGKSLRETATILSTSNLTNFKIDGNGLVIEQIPAPNANLTQTTEIYIKLSPELK